MHNTPKQTKLLGATVQGVGLVVAVSAQLADCYALVEDECSVTHHRFLADLKRDEIAYPLGAQAYTTGIQRVGYGTWDEVHSLVSTQSVLEVAA